MTARTLSASTPTTEKRAAFVVLLVLVLALPIIEGAGLGAVLPGIATLLGILLMTLWGVESIRQPTLRFSVPLAVMLVYLVLTAASVYWSFDDSTTTTRVMNLVKNLLIYFVAVDVCRTKARLDLLLLAYAVGVLPLVYTFVLNVVTNTNYGNAFGRYSANGFDPNNFGVLVASALPIFLYFLRRRPLLSLAVFAVIGGIVLSTGSRSAALGMLLCLLYLLSQNGRSWGSAIRALLVLGFVYFAGSSLLTAFIPAESLQRLTESLESSDVSNGRVDIYRNALDLLGDRVFFGWGGATFPEMTGSSAHNGFVSNAVELGVGGMAIWAYLWFVHLSYAARPTLFIRSDLRSYAGAILTCAACVFISTLTLNWEVRSPTYLVWAFCSILWNLILEKKT